jgi:hypothetical protein
VSGFRPPVRPYVNYHNFNLDLSINGMVVISIQQRQQFEQIKYNFNYKKKNIYGSMGLTHWPMTHQVLVTHLTHNS